MSYNFDLTKDLVNYGGGVLTMYVFVCKIAMFS